MPKDRGEPLGKTFPGLFLKANGGIRAIVELARGKSPEKTFRTGDRLADIKAATQWRKDKKNEYQQKLRGTTLVKYVDLDRPLSVGELFDRLNGVYKTKGSWREMQCYQRDIFEFFGRDFPLGSFTGILLEEWQVRLRRPRPCKNWRNRSVLSYSSCDKRMQHLSSALHRAKENSWVESLPKFPYFRIQGPKTPPITDGQLFKILAALPPDPEPYRAMVLLMINTAQRRQDAFWTEWENLDLDNRVITKFSSTKSNKHHLTIPMYDLLHEELMKLEPISRFCFVSPRTGKPFTNIDKTLRRALNAAGITSGGCHHFRVYAVNAFLKQGFPAEAIAEIAGMTVQNVRYYMRLSILGPEMVSKVNNHLNKQDPRGRSARTPHFRVV